jgi:phosphopantetheine--protein transferase-like protein
MILGIGLDIVRIDRIRRILVGAHCDRFVKRVLHPRERDVMLRMDSASRRAEFVAGRWRA